MSKVERDIRKHNIDLQRSYIERQLKNGNTRYVGELYPENKVYFARRGYFSKQTMSEEDMIEFEGTKVYEFFKKTA